MKKARRIAAMIAAMALAATMVTPSLAFAEDVNIKVLTDGSTANEVTGETPDADKATHTYTAYQIFKGEYITEDVETPEFRITGLGKDAAGLFENDRFLAFRPGPGIDSVSEALAKLDASATDAEKAKAAAAVLSDIENDSDAAKELADILAKIVTGGTTITTDDKPFAEGYYLIKDSYTANGTNDAESRFILRVNSKETPDGITIIPKKSYPEVIKKVQENEKNVLTDADLGTFEGAVDTAEKWNDVADYNIGDNVPFQLYGSLPTTLNDYSAYYYKFTDTLGTQFDQPEEITVAVGRSENLTFTWDKTQNAYLIGSNALQAKDANETEVSHFTYDVTDKFMEQINEACASVDGWAAMEDDDKIAYVYENWNALTAAADETAGTPAGLLVAKGYTAGMNKDKYIIRKKIVDKPVSAAVDADGSTDGNCRVTWDDAKNQLVISFEDIKAYEGVTPNTIVTVNYTAVLNDTAIIGLDGQENKVDLTYSNNPNIEYKPTTDDNGEDKPSDEDTDKTPEDKVVVFTYEIDINKIDGDTKNALSGAEFTLSRETASGKEYVKVDRNGIVTGWTTDADEASKLTSDANGLFKVIGVDSGTYTLTETKAPDGYNLPANPAFEVELNATTLNTQKYTSSDYQAAEDVLTKIAGTLDGEDMAVLDEVAGVRGARGGVEGTIENNKGTNLPSTGGIGTLMFVLCGGVAAGIAGVYLVSKKKTREEEV